MKIVHSYWRPCILLITAIVLTETADPSATGPDDYNVQHNDGSFEFGYDTKDHFHHADGTKDNFVRGQFGARNPATGAIDTTSYTAGPRGYRPRGKNIHRKYDLSQVGPRPIGSKDDPYYDPTEDPSYNFSFRTRTYNRQEAANRVGDVTGRYSYLDDVGERHNVEYIAGKNTGFHVKTPYPDSNPRATGPLYYQGPGKPPRGRTSIQRGLDGSYRFVSAGPDQRRTEMSDASGHVRGSYTFIDDKGTQHTVHYIAGPETGYRVLKNVKGPHFPNWYPFGLGRPGYPVPDFADDYADKNIEDIFDNPKEHLNTAASGHVKPPKNGFGTTTGSDKSSGDDDKSWDSFGDNLGRPSAPKKPSFYKPTGTRRPGVSNRPFLDDDFSSTSAGDDNFGDDLFKPSASGDSSKPSKDIGVPNRPSKHGGGHETSTTGGRPSSTASTFFSDDSPKPFDKSDDDQFDLFGGGNKGSSTSSSGGRKPSSHKGDDFGEPVHIGATFDGKGTILKNIGDKFISFPPGIAVRAHVQSIDILPYGSRLPSPSEQLKAESSTDSEEKKDE